MPTRRTAAKGALRNELEEFEMSKLPKPTRW